MTHIKETHKDALSDNKERYKDCQKNMNTQHFSSWTNTRQMDKSKFFPLYFFNRTWDNVFYVLDTSSNMHGTHKNSPYGQTNQKNSLFFGFFFTRIVGQTGTPNFAVSDKKKIPEPCMDPLRVKWWGPKQLGPSNICELNLPTKLQPPGMPTTGPKAWSWKKGPKKTGSLRSNPRLVLV